MRPPIRRMLAAAAVGAAMLLLCGSSSQARSVASSYASTYQIAISFPQGSVQNGYARFGSDKGNARLHVNELNVDATADVVTCDLLGGISFDDTAVDIYGSSDKGQTWTKISSAGETTLGGTQWVGFVPQTAEGVPYEVKAVLTYAHGSNSSCPYGEVLATSNILTETPDSTPPTTVATIPAQATAGKARVVTLRASDATSGVATTSYCLAVSSGGWCAPNKTGSSVTLPAGSKSGQESYWLAYQSTDNAGNVEDLHQQYVQVDWTKAAPTAGGSGGKRGGGSPATDSATIQLSLKHGLIGQATLVSGKGFRPQERITLTLNQRSAYPYASVEADGQGRFADAALEIPSTTQAGPASISAHGQASGRSATTVFTVDPATDLALAQKFSPYLLFDNSEHWRPLDVENFFITTKPYVCRTPTLDCRKTRVAEDTDIYPTGYLDQSYSGHPDGVSDPSTYRSPVAGCASGKTYECSQGPSTAIYYHSKVKGGYRYLDYWFFYRFNDAPGAGIADQHEGDWEGVTVAVPANDPDPVSSHSAAFAVHAGWFQYLNGIPLTCGNKQTCAGAQHVDAYVAAGTHASYPQPCSAKKNVLGIILIGGCTHTEPEKGIVQKYLLSWLWRSESGHDGNQGWKRNGDPDAVLPLPTGNWNGWAGNWNPGSSPSVRGPGSGRQKRYGAPWNATCITGCDKRRSVKSVFHLGAAKAVGDPTNPCSGWDGPGVAAVICDPAVVSSELASGTLTGTGSTAVTGNNGQNSSVPGLDQFIGPPLNPGQSLQIAGQVSPGSLIAVVSNDGYTTRESAFSGVSLTAGQSMTVNASSTGAMSISTPAGVMQPIETRTVVAKPPTPVSILVVRLRGKNVYVKFRATAPKTSLEITSGAGKSLYVAAGNTAVTRPGRTYTWRMKLRIERRPIYLLASSISKDGFASKVRRWRVGK